MRVIDEMKITHAFRGRNGANNLRNSILILILISFQLGSAALCPVWASQKLPVFQMGEAPDKPAPMLLKSVSSAGFRPRLVRESDFLFQLNATENPYVLVPLSGNVTPSALAMLGRYVNAGGKVILAAAGENPDPAVLRLIQLIGITASGSTVLTKEAPLYWRGATLPTADALPQGSRLLLIQPGREEQVLASWGNAYPAIIATEQGALLNWPPDYALSQTAAVMALSRLMPLSKPDSIVFAPATPRRSPESDSQNPVASGLPGLGNRPQSRQALDPVYQPNPVTPVKKALIPVPPVVPQWNPTMAIAATPAKATPQPEAMAQKTVSAGTLPQPGIPDQAEPSLSPSVQPASPAQTAQPAVSVYVAKPAQPAEMSGGQASAVVNVMPQGALAQKPAQNSVQKPVKAASKPETAAVKPKIAHSADGDAENEVLQNIMGGTAPTENSPTGSKPTGDVTRPDDPLLKDKLGGQAPAESATEATSGTTEEKRQKHFSFLDAEAADVIAPEFDYGTYTYNLRILEDYRRRINDALETSRQLSLDVPEEKVRQLLREAHLHKRKFESFYLGNQTQAGLDEFAQARKITLQALALTSASPRVESRAIWLDRGTILEARNQQDLSRLMQKLRQAGINIVYFETLNAGFPIYPSAILKPNPMVQGWDPLKAAVEEGHKLGMEVHAWVWAFAVGNRRHNPLIGQPESYPGPILVDAGLMSEALRNRDGGLNVDNRQNEYWLDPASTKARGFLLSVYQEIVRHYDVDGLHLDYIRYPFQTAATRMGFDPVGREHFHRATGQSLDNLDDYTARVWTAWKTYQVSSFVQQVSTTLRQIKPNIKISAAVFPMKRESRIVTIQQDWETWIDNGWVDTLSPMSYTSDPQRLQGMFDYVQSSPQKRSLIYPGIALHRLDGGQLVQQLEALRQRGGLGATLFAGAHLDQEKIDTLGAGPFKDHTGIPPHRDVVKSLQLILDDYRQKFGTLQTKGALADLPADQMKAITEPMTQLAESLAALSAFKNPANMPAGPLNQAQQQLSALQAATGVWLQGEAQHPFRAQYFSQKMMLLNELLGYLADKNKGAIATFAPPNALPNAQQPVAAKPVLPANSATSTGTTLPVSSSNTVPSAASLSSPATETVANPAAQPSRQTPTVAN